MCPAEVQGSAFASGGLREGEGRKGQKAFLCFFIEQAVCQEYPRVFSAKQKRSQKMRQEAGGRRRKKRTVAKSHRSREASDYICIEGKTATLADTSNKY